MDAEGDDVISFSSKGTTVSGWGRRKMDENDKRTAVWRQLYLSRAKLKAVSRTSALIAGFAMIAMVEVSLETNVIYPKWLLVTFSTVTTCLVSVHLFALMISTCLLPNIEAISNIHNLNAAKHSPHVKMRTYIETSWILSTGVGLVLFLIEIALLIWLKFHGLRGKPTSQSSVTNGTSTTDCYGDNCDNALWASWSATIVLVPVILLFAGFAFHFYRALAQHKYGVFTSYMRELNDLELRQDDISGQMRQASMLEGGLYAHQDLSRMHSAASGTAVQYRPNSQSNAIDRLKVDSFMLEHESTNSGRTTPSMDVGH
uniref:calcium release-activated calcium channel protein 1-like n=1 Tax=Styela clava TaxID=7725 RepID=UPI00193A9710|nr:calcium release-activated calcium channel protein 1-like [Styela clava]XP_039267069.1 calcium release-activated calcium channel protein 1-like [Styela clava]